MALIHGITIPMYNIYIKSVTHSIYVNGYGNFDLVCQSGVTVYKSKWLLVVKVTALWFTRILTMYSTDIWEARERNYSSKRECLGWPR